MVDDQVPDPGETMVFTLSNPAGCTIGFNKRVPVDISESLPTIYVNPLFFGQTIIEGITTSPLSFQLIMDRESTREMKAELKVITDGNPNGTDFRIPVTEVTFHPGEREKQLDFFVVDDKVKEPTKLVHWQITSSTGCAIWWSSGEFSLFDNDYPKMSLSTSSFVYSESDPNIKVTIVADSPFLSDTDVYYYASTPRRNGSPYIWADKVTFLAGQARASVSLDLNDTVYYGNTTLTFRLQYVGFLPVQKPSVTLLILEDEARPATGFSAPNLIAPQNNTGRTDLSLFSDNIIAPSFSIFYSVYSVNAQTGKQDHLIARRIEHVPPSTLWPNISFEYQSLLSKTANNTFIIELDRILLPNLISLPIRSQQKRMTLTII